MTGPTVSAARWAGPPPLRPALVTAGFATELRDLLARCAERGVDPQELQRIGRRHARPEWLAAGRFAQAYEQIMLLRSAVGMAAPQATVPALGAAELVGAALDALAADPELLAAERGRLELLLVDDAQHLDPQAALLVRVLAAGAGLTVLAGDPNQTGVRLPRRRSGAAERRRRAGDQAVGDVIGAPARWRARSRGWRGGCRAPDGHRPFTGAPERSGSVAVQLAATSHAEAALIADTLRRAHLVDGVPWSQMAVIVRSVPRSGAAVARALTAAGVPVQMPSPDAPLAARAPVAALLTVLSAVGARPRRRGRAGPADRADRAGRSGVAASAASAAAPPRR